MEIKLQFGRSFVRKRLLIMFMRTFIFLLCTTVFSFNTTNSFSQEKVLIDHDQLVSVNQVFKIIKKQTKYHFIYPLKAFNDAPKVQLIKGEIGLTELLKLCLSSNNLRFELSANNGIVIKKSIVNQDVGKRQEIVISGVVNDDTGQPLPGANILEKGTTNGTQTDFDGNFSINVANENSVLTISYVGFTTQEIAIAGQSTITIQMKPDASALDEIILVGYGAQKKVNLTGAVVGVTADDLVKSPVQNAVQSIQGRVPGLRIIQESGVPGEEQFLMQIRGVTSFGGSTAPLVIIDGIQGEMSMLNPNDIESVNVLKDASASAIYGARAANGVILITTKSGKSGELTMEYKTNIGVHKMIMPWKRMTTTALGYVELMNSAYENNVAAGYPNVGRTYTQEQVDFYRANPDVSTDWIDYASRSPIVQNHYLKASGGSESAKYDVSMGYFDQDGILYGYDFKKYTTKVKVDFKINKHIDFGVNILGTFSNRNEPRHGDFHRSNAWLRIINIAPTFNPRTPDGEWASRAYSFELPWTENPAVYLNKFGDGVGGTNVKGFNFQGTAYLKLNIMKGLTLESNASTRYMHTERKLHQKPVRKYLYHSGVFDGYVGGISDPSIRETRSRNVLNTVNVLAKYKTTLDEQHNLAFLAGYSQENFISNSINAFRRYFPSSNLDALNAGSQEDATNGGSISDWAIQSLFGRINYNFSEKYLFEASFRYDGSSRFHKDHRWGFFPSMSAGWRLSKESFLKDVSWIHNLKLRASWGRLGNQDVGVYPYQDVVSFGESYPFEGTLVTGAFINKFPNKEISWETTTSSNLGLDFSMKNGLFSATVEVFERHTTDIIRNLQVPSALGLSGPIVNQGEMKNTGFEVILGHKGQLGDVRYAINANFSHFKNELVKFGARQIAGNFIREEGLPYNSFYLVPWDGIFQSQEEIDAAPIHPYPAVPGDIRLKDTNGDGKIDSDDRKVMDGAYPDFDFGLNLSVEYKNFDFSALFRGEVGRKRFVFRNQTTPFMHFITPSTVWEDAWTPENPSNEFPRLYNLSSGSIPSIRYQSSWQLTPADYIRLKNLTVGYTFPSSLVDKIGIKGARMYFSGENLLTKHNMKFPADPENIQSQDWNQDNPKAKVFSFGLDIKF